MTAPRIIPLFFPRKLQIKYRGGKKGFNLNLINMVKGARVRSSHESISFDQDVLRTGSIVIKCYVNLLLLAPGYTNIQVTILDAEIEGDDIGEDKPIYSFPIKILFDGEPKPPWMFWN